MDSPIILIGPPNVGKTTIAGLLAQKLGVTHHELDDLRWDYYNEIGYDHEHAKRLRAEVGFDAMYRYWKPFDIHAVERILQEVKDGVISFGAGHSVYEDAAMLERAQRALAPFKNVILLLPCADVAAAAAVLKERITNVFAAEGWTPSQQMLDLFDHFLQHPSNRLLAKWVVYTEGKSPEETCEEIAICVG